MRVACVGNMNNSFFTIVRYLRDRGVDARLALLRNEQPHFHPSADTFDFTFEQFTDHLPWGELWGFMGTPAALVADSLAGYDFIVACGTAPAFIDKGGRRVDILVPYGHDITNLPFVDWRIYKWGGLKSCLQWVFRRAHRRAILRAGCVNMEHRHPQLSDIVRRLGIDRSTVYFGIPMVYHPMYVGASLEAVRQHASWFEQFKQLRDQHDLIVFHHSRHIWKTFVDQYSDKGNEVLIEGFARFVERNRSTRACLVMLAYGRDVQASKDLITRRGLEPHVRWFPQMPRKEVLAGLSLADVGTGQFRLGGVGGGTVFETLALGKPLLHKRNPLRPVPGLSDYPHVEVDGPGEVCDALEDCCRHREKWQALGDAAQRWYAMNIVQQSVDCYVELIRAKAEGRGLSDAARSFVASTFQAVPNGTHAD